jgi:hypothetical protein
MRWGRCYDHSFCDFYQFSGGKNWRFSQQPMLWSYFCTIYLCFEPKNAIFFAQFFGEFLKKIITSDPVGSTFDIQNAVDSCNYSKLYGILACYKCMLKYCHRSFEAHCIGNHWKLCFFLWNIWAIQLTGFISQKILEVEGNVMFSIGRTGWIKHFEYLAKFSPRVNLDKVILTKGQPRQGTYIIHTHSNNINLVNQPLYT